MPASPIHSPLPVTLVPRRPSGRPCCPTGQLPLEHLAGRVARQLVDEDDVARHLVAGQVGPHVLLAARPRDDRRRVRTTKARSRCPYSSSSTPTAATSATASWATSSPRPPAGTRSRRRRRSCRRRDPRRSSRPASSKRPRSPVDISPVDDLLGPAAGVALEEQPVADEDPARLAPRQLVPVVVEDRHVGAERRLARPTPARRAGPPGSRSGPRHLGRAVDVVEVVAERSIQRPARSPGSADPTAATTSTRDRSYAVEPPSGSSARMRCNITGMTTSDSQPCSSTSRSAVLRVERAAQHHGRAEQHASAKCAQPQVWNIGAAMWVDHRVFSGSRDSRDTAASIRPRSAARPWGARVPEVRIATAPRARASAGRSSSCRRPRLDVSIGRPEGRVTSRSTPITRAARSVGSNASTRSANSSSYTTAGASRARGRRRAGDRRRRCSGRAGPRRAARRRSWPRRSTGGCGTSPPPSRPHRHRARTERAGHGVAAPLDLVEGQLTEVVDQADRVGETRGQRDGACGGPCPPRRKVPPSRASGKAVGPDHAGVGKHLGGPSGSTTS